ncbi:hypothetical protein GYMLUDRAFT_401092 [Collybiopsis luxurians FD-317 M1]|nr:hypothetical protein GYMLUDRAFT_401092 [Collybiopsis luxurians FD-317 M1]
MEIQDGRGNCRRGWFRMVKSLVEELQSVPSELQLLQLNRKYPCAYETTIKFRACGGAGGGTPKPILEMVLNDFVITSHACSCCGLGSTYQKTSSFLGCLNVLEYTVHTSISKGGRLRYYLRFPAVRCNVFPILSSGQFPIAILPHLLHETTHSIL